MNSSVRCQCPVCGANQDWSAECRRCSADLGLLLEVARAVEVARRKCLLAIARGHHREALGWAQRLVRLRTDDVGKQLLAVCHLLCRDFSAATSLAK